MRLRLPNPLAALDDRALLARFADHRDGPAFEQLVKRHGRLVFGVCRRLLGDPHRAEDAFQAVFLVLARDPRRAADAASVGGWLFGVARRVGLAARRHELRRARREALAPARNVDARPPSEINDLLAALDEELAALPDDLRAALVACFLEERTHDEAARELGWSVSTLRRRLDRGKELLRVRLARRGVSLAVGLLTTALAAPSARAVPPLAPSPAAAALAAEVLRRGVGAKALAAVAGVALMFGAAAFGLTPAPVDVPDAPPVQPKVAGAVAKAVAVAPPRPVPPKKWATLSGRVVFERDRDLPKARPVPADLVKDADVWKPFGPLTYATTTIDPNTRGVADVIVFLRPDSDDRKADFPLDRAHPDRAAAKPQDCAVALAGPRFAPRVLAARAGDRLVFQNQLPVAVTVAHVASPDGGNPKVNFNVMLARGDTYTSDPLTATTHPDQFANHIHPWMDGFVWAFDHPYFAVTDATGRFELPDVPTGAWRLVVWHQVAGWAATGRLGTKFTLTADRELAPITLAADSWPK
jgi:RNA polymerase sigma factor (sigma-70 family)